MTFSTESRKSFSVATFLLARIANMPASVHTECSSAPVEPGHNLAIKSNLMSRSTDMLMGFVMVRVRTTCFRTKSEGEEEGLTSWRECGEYVPARRCREERIRFVDRFDQDVRELGREYRAYDYEARMISNFALLPKPPKKEERTCSSPSKL